MKKTFSILITIIILNTISIHALAIDNIPLTEEQQIEYIAYQDLSKADRAEKEQILDAREKIIFNQSWVADGTNGYVINADGEIIEELPQFHDIFPDDWDLPILEYNQDKLYSESIITDNLNTNKTLSSTSPDVVLPWTTIKLYKPSDTVNSIPFTTIKTTDRYADGEIFYRKNVFTMGACHYPAEEHDFNVGYSNAETGQSLAWRTHIPNAAGFLYEPPRDIKLAVRASSYDGPREWQIRIDATNYNTGDHRPLSN